MESQQHVINYQQIQTTYFIIFFPVIYNGVSALTLFM